MPKIAVERPRHRHADRYPRGHLRCLYGWDLEALPQKEALSWRRYGSKDFSDNLAPLYRFLRSSIGRPWNKVWADMCAAISFDNAVQKHILGHVFGIVEAHVELRGTEPYPSSRSWRHRVGMPLRGSGRWPSLYVCPKSGLLKQAKHIRRKKPKPLPDPGIVWLGSMERLHRVQGVWYREVLKRDDKGALVVVSKRQLNSRELVRLGMKGQESS
jgi:hypothetical protein